MQLSIIIVSWNTCNLLRRCLETLRTEIDLQTSEVFVIDNASHDGSAAMVAAEHPWVQLVANNTNAGFAKGNNQALKVATGDYVLLLNPDTEVVPGSISTLLNFLQHNPTAGIVAPQLLNSDGTIQRSCRRFPTFTAMLYELVGLSKAFPGIKRFREYKMLDFNHDHESQVDQPEGACLLVRRKVIDDVGMLDEGFFMLFEEVDWCYRIKQSGWEIWFTPKAKVIHHYGQSIKQVKVPMILSSHKGLYRFWRKHYCGQKTYLAPLAYTGLMALAILRILSYSGKKAFGLVQ